eukprot:SAG31_NODE_20377_length_576_cov_1.184486_1_plen_35_part_10
MYLRLRGAADRSPMIRAGCHAWRTWSIGPPAPRSS